MTLHKVRQTALHQSGTPKADAHGLGAGGFGNASSITVIEYGGKRTECPMLAPFTCSAKPLGSPVYV